MEASLAARLCDIQCAVGDIKDCIGALSVGRNMGNADAYANRHLLSIGQQIRYSYVS